jgi:putative addiction module CopG family antidote
MNLSLNPETQKFIDEQVKAGRYHSPEAVLEDAVKRMMDEDAMELDDETLAAIDESEDQIARGEYRDWEDVSAELRAKYLGGK